MTRFDYAILATITADRVINVQSVLIIENQMLLGAGVQTLLAGEADLEVIGISPSSQERLAQEVSRLRPDVIVLDETSHLAGPTKLLSLLKDSPKLRIVVISANHNLVRIYNKQETRLGRTTDLFDIIRERSFDDQTS